MENKIIIDGGKETKIIMAIPKVSWKLLCKVISPLFYVYAVS